MGAFKVAHQYYCDFFTNDAWDEEKAQAKVGKYYTEERTDYIRKFYECLLNSKKMNEVGLMYVRHSNLSVRKVVELYNESLKESKRENPNTVKSRIILCASKVNNSFEDVTYKDSSKKKEIKIDPLELIMTVRIVNDSIYQAIREAEEQIDRFVEMFDTSKNKKDYLLFRMPTFAKVDSLSDYEFECFFDIIRPYSKRQVESVEMAMYELKKEVGYFNYLMTPGVKLTGVDKERRDTLLRWLGISTLDKEENQTEDDLLDFDCEQ